MICKKKIFLIFFVSQSYSQTTDPFSSLKDSAATVTLLGIARTEKISGAIIKFNTTNNVSVWTKGQEDNTWLLKEVNADSIILISKKTKKELNLSL